MGIRNGQTGAGVTGLSWVVNGGHFDVVGGAIVVKDAELAAKIFSPLDA